MRVYNTCTVVTCVHECGHSYIINYVCMQYIHIHSWIYVVWWMMIYICQFKVCIKSRIGVFCWHWVKIKNVFEVYVGRIKNYPYIHGGPINMLPIEKLLNCVHSRNRITKLFKTTDSCPQFKVCIKSRIGVFCWHGWIKMKNVFKVYVGRIKN